MSTSDSIDGRVSSKQCKLAVDALLGHALKVQKQKEDTELLPGKEQHVWLVLTVKQMHPEKKVKPHKIPIVHPLVDPRTTNICLITKDPQREYKDLLESHGIRFISRVVGISKLKGKFKPFEARRLLLQENGMFLADERVVPLLPGLLGKKFFEAKKQPVPVCLTRKDLKGELERAISSTYMHQNLGTCTSIKVGTLSQTPAQVLANLKTALPAVVKAVKGQWDNVQSLHIKTNSSVSLPIWSCNLGTEEGGRWHGLVASDESEGSEDEEMDVDEDKDSEVKKPASKTVDKGKKRAAEEIEEKPKKKAKSAAEHVPLPKEAAAGKTKKADSSSKAIASKVTVPQATPAVPSERLGTAAVDIPSQKTKQRKASEPEVPPAKISKAKSKADAAAAVVPVPVEEPVVSSGAEADADTEPVVESSLTQKDSKKRRKKNRSAAPSDEAVEAAAAALSKSADQSSTEPVFSKPVGASALEAALEDARTDDAGKKKRRKKTGEVDVDGEAQKAEVAPPTTRAPPATPSKDKKKDRPTAVEFFEAEPVTPGPSVPAPPTNTPSAVGGAADSEGAKKKRRKISKTEPSGVDALEEAAPATEPVKEALSSAALLPTPAAEGGPAKKQRKPMHKAKQAAEDHIVAEPAAEAHESGAGNASSDLVTQNSETKGKRKERKKDKVAQGKPGKSVKEEVIGKKASLA